MGCYPSHACGTMSPTMAGWVRAGEMREERWEGWAKDTTLLRIYISYLGTDRPRSSMNFFRSTMYHG